jgi:hypothetical protein
MNGENALGDGRCAAPSMRWVFSPLDCSAHLLLVEDNVLPAQPGELLALAVPTGGRATSWTCPDCRAVFLLDSAAAGELARQDE